MPRQLNIEGTEAEEFPVRILHRPSNQEIKTSEQWIGQNTKATLQTMAQPFVDLMRKFRFRYDCGDGKTETPDAIAMLERSKTQPKAVWQRFLAIFYHEKNYTIVFENMPKREIELWREVLRNHFLPKDETNRIIGGNCFERDDDYWFYTSCNLKKPFSSFFHTIAGKYEAGEFGSRRHTTFIYIGTFRQRMMLMEFFPDLVDLKGLKSLPEEDDLKRYCGESTIFGKLPILSSFYDSGLLPSGFAKLTVSVVKKLQNILAIPDFFDTYPERKQASLSAALMLNFYLFFREHYWNKEIPSNPIALIKAVINEGFAYNDFTLPVLLPYMRGIKKSKLESGNFEYVMTVMKCLLKMHHEKGWLPVDSLIMKIRTFDTTADEQFILVNPLYFDEMNMRNSYAADQYIHLGNIVSQLSEPFVKALLFALSTFGIVEIAYREPQDCDTSYYDGLSYVRLTELGKYVLDISKSYTPHAAADNGPAFELDDQRLLIKATDTHSPFLPLLSDFATPVTPSLYRVDYDTFLTGCTCQGDVKRKTDMFRQYICPKLPPVWKQFFDEMLSRCDPFSKPDDKYTLLTIPPDNTTLARLVLTEPSLRRYVRKAEGYMLLVKTNEMKKFAEAMKKFGYLI